MAKFNLLKTLGLQRVVDKALAGFKKDVVREIDRALGKLDSGETSANVVQALHSAIADMLAHIPLPPPLGTVVASILLMVPWDRLLHAPSDQVIHELARLKRQVEGARL